MSVRVHEHALGLTWVVEEALERASHALADDGRVWLIDPVDDAAAVQRALGLGTPAAVVQLLDRHDRDAATLAARLGVPHLRLPDTVPDAPFEVIRALEAPCWHERALWWPQRRALVVAEVVGTSPHVTFGVAPAAIHPFLRLLPPGSLRGRVPEHLLVGHGEPLHGPTAAQALAGAYAGSRRDIPAMLRAAPGALRAMREAGGR